MELQEIFDDFSKSVYAEQTLMLGHEGKNIILVIDDITKKAVFQYNLFDIEGNLFEVISQNKNQLYSSIHEFLKSFRLENFNYDAEAFFTDPKRHIDQFIQNHIKATFYIPDIPFYSVYNEIV